MRDQWTGLTPGVDRRDQRHPGEAIIGCGSAVVSSFTRLHTLLDTTNRVQAGSPGRITTGCVTTKQWKPLICCRAGGLMTSVLARPPEGSGLKDVPGVPGIPYIGNTLQVMRRPYYYARKRYYAYGAVSWGWLLGQRVVTVQGPEAAEVVLVNRDKAFANGPAWSYFIGPFFYRGIMLLDFDEHLHHRRIMQQAFTQARLRSYRDAMAPGVVKGLDAWEPSRNFKVYDHIKQLTLDLATDVFMGVELSQAERDHVNGAFVDAVRAGTAYVRFPVPGLRWHKGLQARKVLEGFFRRHLPAKRRDGGDDLFAALCEAETDDGHRLTDEDLVNHMLFALMAAHDTTTITLTTMAYHLAKFPEWQERLRAESLAFGKPDLDYAEW